MLLSKMDAVGGGTPTAREKISLIIRDYLTHRGKNRFAEFLIFLMLVGCSCQSKKKPNRKDVLPVIKTSNASLNWRQDKYGCMKIRNEKIAEKLVRDYDLKNNSEVEFLKVFGSPNEIKEHLDERVWVYYFDCICQENNLVKHGDKCYANFHFENNKLKFELYLCE